jgi:hypothetical protein
MACGEDTTPLDPHALTGHYALSDINGRAVPHTVASAPAGCATELAFGDLALAEGVFSLTLLGTWGICPGVAAALGDYTVAGRWDVQQRALVFRAIDPTSPLALAMTFEGSVSVLEAHIRLPPGVLTFVTPTTLRFVRSS